MKLRRFPNVTVKMMFSALDSTFYFAPTFCRAKTSSFLNISYTTGGPSCLFATSKHQVLSETGGVIAYRGINPFMCKVKSDVSVSRPPFG